MTRRGGEGTRGGGAGGGTGGGTGFGGETGLVRRDYVYEMEQVGRFMRDFVEIRESEYGTEMERLKYREMLEAVAGRRARVVRVSMDDFAGFVRDAELVREVERNAFRFVWLLARAIDMELATIGRHEYHEEDVVDVLHMFRMQRQVQRVSEQQQDAAVALDSEPDTTPLPAALLRRYEIQVVPRREHKVLAIRKLTSKAIGRLVVTRGMVTRVSDVKPLLVVATYTCDSCTEEIYQEVSGDNFMPLMRCPNPSCSSTNPNAGGVSNILHLQTRGSKFLKSQELRVQELAETVPIGHIPRGIKVHLTGELTRQVTPGDIVTIAGIFLPAPFKGTSNSRVRASGALLADTYLLAQDIQRHKKSYSETELSSRQIAEVRIYAERPNAYEELARSIAPEIYGHEDIKKALLLMMVGAPTRTLADGMRIRGDINVCLMGDPGVAKSQLLKSVSKMSPRGVYTSGKGSSGVGLTAAVLKDPVTGDFVLEGGSLVLADMGVCCIDEFDKMSEADRTSIHEVMEQQTISIAKAGITTSLNARTSILAAANPLYGRYNPKRSPSENINLPAALLSRFDLLFLLLDKHDPISDMAFARHVLYVHTHNTHPPLEFTAATSEFLRAYVSFARLIDPHIPHLLSDYIVNCYVNMRERMQLEGNQGTYITARTLLAIMRLAQALARLRLTPIVERADVDEAMRLMEMSKASLDDPSSQEARREENPTTGIYSIIREIAAKSLAQSASYHSEILPRVLAVGYTQDQLEQCLTVYEQIDVWHVSRDRSTIQFVG
ncbi:MAG: AAA family ATPase [archaeon]|nr:AAA family ATPase [archaeon]